MNLESVSPEPVHLSPVLCPMCVLKTSPVVEPSPSGVCPHLSPVSCFLFSLSQSSWCCWTSHPCCPCWTASSWSCRTAPSLCWGVSPERHLWPLTFGPKTENKQGSVLWGLWSPHRLRSESLTASNSGNYPTETTQCFLSLTGSGFYSECLKML